MAPNPLPPDPLQSPVWEAMVERFLNGAPVVFDDAVQVGLPPVTEDQTQVPVTVDARRLGAVEELVVLGELNPFPLAIRLKPGKAPAYVGFRMRIEQGTVIRAAVRRDGQWHVGGAYLDAAGGGCSAPPVVESKVDWDQLGHMRARLWRASADMLRLRLRINHPMDTGLQKAPAFFIQSVALKDYAGAPLADIEVHEGIAMNPTFTISIVDPKAGDHIAVVARDSDGGNFTAKIPVPPADQSFKEGRL